MATQRKIVLRKCVAPKYALNKDLYMIGNKKTIKDFVVKDNVSIENPHFIIKTFEGIVGYNYLYWSDWERDYFITDYIILPQGQVELVCEVDTLYSFREALKELVVFEERATNGQSNLIADSEVPVMQNSIIKDILPLEMKYGCEFALEDVNQYVFTTYSGKWFSTNGLDGETPVDGNNAKEYSWEDYSSTQQEVALAIAKKARDYLDFYNQHSGETDAMNRNADNNKVYKYAVGYTQSENILSVTGGYGLYFNDSRTLGFTPSRFDTPDLDEVNATVGLNWTKNPNISNQVPQEVKDAGYGWYGWDCSMLAWRCAFFGGNFNLLKPDNPTYNTVGSPTTVEIAVKMLNYTLQKEIGGVMDYQNAQVIVNSEKDLLPGDIIIRGNVADDGIKRKSYWLMGERTNYAGAGPDGNKWVFSYSSHLTTESRKPTKEDIENKGCDFLMFVNHALIVETSSNYIESTGGYWYQEKGVMKKAGGSPIRSTNIQPIQKISADKVTVFSDEAPAYCNGTKDGDFYLIVLRPVKLLKLIADGYTAVV